MASILRRVSVSPLVRQDLIYVLRPTSNGTLVQMLNAERTTAHGLFDMVPHSLPPTLLSEVSVKTVRAQVYYLSLTFSEEAI